MSTGKIIFRWIKRITLVLLFSCILFYAYAAITYRNNIDMTTKQKILKAAYPALMWFTNLTKTNAAVLQNETVQPPVSLYAFSATGIDGKPFDLASLKGRKILIVNTASDCGYTDQLDDLEKLYQQSKDNLIIVAFPANDFKEQEKGSDTEIASFCRKNYGVTFPIMSKSVVIISSNQHPVFQWLTDPAKNGWNKQPPSWNFSKYLINENGMLVNYFGPSISPLSKEVLAAVKK